MHGTNELRKQELREDGHLQVHEIFETIQGEGPYSGHRAVFIRLTGCMLACMWCDTHWDDGKDPFYAPDDLVKKVHELTIDTSDWNDTHSPWLVVLTGGEPMRQNIGPLIRKLVTAGYNVQIETAGVYSLPDFDAPDFPMVKSPQNGIPGAHAVGCSIVCSPKTGAVHKQIEANCTNWKYIIRAGEVDPSDGLPDKSTQVPGLITRVYRARAPMLYNMVYLQPCDDGNKDKNLLNMLAAITSAKMFGYKMGVQLHKIIGLP